MKRKSGTNKLPFGKILKGVMQERGLTVRAVAEMAGVSPSVVQGWVTKANPHDLQAVARLAQALGMSFKALLLGETESIGKAAAVSDLFLEQDLFDGLCKVSIKRLVPRVKEDE